MLISLTKIKKTLNNCAFDPRKNVLMRPVVENVENYPDYAIMKAIELLREHQQLINSGDYEDSHPDLTNKLKQAIQLLALRLAQ